MDVKEAIKGYPEDYLKWIILAIQRIVVSIHHRHEHRHEKGPQVGLKKVEKATKIK
jgi:hypothetical protein